MGQKTMAIVTRYRIERLICGQTEYYDGCETTRYDGWQGDACGAEGFRTYAKAQRRADRIGGEVTRFQTIANLPDAFVAPTLTLIAAE